METRKKLIFEKIQNYSNIINYFGSQFLEEAINSFEVIADNKKSPKNHFISNYIMSSFYINLNNSFVSELDNLLYYFLKHHVHYINSSNVKKRLIAKKEQLFQGIWSELIFAYYLAKNNFEIEEMSKLQKTEKGEIELFDIKTEFGEIEVTAVMSKKGIISDTANIFGSPLEIDELTKQLINRKIKRKSGKKILAIDCTFIKELSQRLMKSEIGFNIKFKVLKPTSKNVFLFDRDPKTQQVGYCKLVN